MTEQHHRRKTDQPLPLNLSRILEVVPSDDDSQDIMPISVISAKKVVDYHEKEKSDLIKKGATDTLTGLLNRSGLEDNYKILQHTYSSRRESDDPHVTHSMLFVDLDKFKDINDTIGHPNADKLLQIIAKFMEGECRSDDFIGRFGGDEFVIMLPKTSQEEAAFVAERIRSAVEGISEIEGRPVNPSTSIGVGLVDPNLGFGEVMESADQALLQAKEQGRNQVVVFEPKAA